MKYFQSVLAFGDSHVAGCELSDLASLEDYTSGKLTLEQADDAGKEFAFPQLVADQLNIPCYNYAMTGGSNARSLRLLIQAVQQHPNALILFGYTCTDRTEFYYPDAGTFLGRDKDNFLQVGMQWEGAIKDTGMTHPINDIFIKNILREHDNLNDLMFLVDSIGVLNAITTLHLPLFNGTTPADIDVFDFQGHGSYLSWCKANSFKQMPYLHYYRDAHAALAELILKEIK
jgi:hypothetical protein